jgi:hypothetical protein
LLLLPLFLFLLLNKNKKGEEGRERLLLLPFLPPKVAAQEREDCLLGCSFGCEARGRGASELRTRAIKIDIN